MPQAPAGTSRAAILNEFRWDPETRVPVAFLEGDQDLRQRVERITRYSGIRTLTPALSAVSMQDRG
jgi:hypothetical protein